MQRIEICGVFREDETSAPLELAYSTDFSVLKLYHVVLCKIIYTAP